MLKLIHTIYDDWEVLWGEEASIQINFKKHTVIIRYCLQQVRLIYDSEDFNIDNIINELILNPPEIFRGRLNAIEILESCDFLTAKLMEFYRLKYA